MTTNCLQFQFLESRWIELKAEDKHHRQSRATSDRLCSARNRGVCGNDFVLAAKIDEPPIELE